MYPASPPAMDTALVRPARPAPLRPVAASLLCMCACAMAARIDPQHRAWSAMLPFCAMVLSAAFAQFVCAGAASVPGARWRTLERISTAAAVIATGLAGTAFATARAAALPVLATLAVSGQLLSAHFRALDRAS